MILSFNIVVYLFCAGAGSGLYAVQAAERLWAAHQAAPSLQQRLQDERIPLALAGLLCGLGALFLLADLGKPERMISLFFNPHPTAITVGAYALVVFVVAVALQFFARYLTTMAVPRRVDALLGAVAAVAACVIMVYAGLLLAFMPGIDLWASPWLPILFVVSALSSGCALLMMLDTLTLRSLGELRATLSMADRLLIAVEAVFLTVLLVTVGAMSDDGARAVWSLVGGEYAWAFWLGLVVVGLLVPFALESVEPRLPVMACLEAATAVAILVGCFMLRYCIVAGGAYGSIVLPALSL
ncbi:MAG: polysulfide reductase NrfD [Adlercreutzia sp.]|nr:polysulfide reductase NrfD [Adlercreutzia sp.]